MREHVAETKSTEKALTRSVIQHTGAEQNGAPGRGQSYGHGASAGELRKTVRSGHSLSSPRVARPLLQMQRTYGNRYVQRFLALARQGEGEGEVTPEIESAIERSRGGGQALDTGVRRQMESAFGVDFGGVRVHTGSESHSLNRAVSAIAFTTGQDIFFRDGAYAPQSSGGRELLAHELTHVVQQGGSSSVQGKLVVGEANDQYEQEADRVAKSVISTLDLSATSEALAPDSVAPLVQRQCACGGHTASGEGCEGCRKARESGMQRFALKAIFGDRMQRRLSLLPTRGLQRRVVCPPGVSPDDGEGCYEVADDTPADGGVTPADGGVTPADGGVTPADGGVTPADGGVTPADGGGGGRAAPPTPSPGTSVGRSLCHAAMWALGTGACVAITAACAGATAVTVGGFAIPCVYAIPAVCMAGAGGASLASEQLCDRFID